MSGRQSLRGRLWTETEVRELGGCALTAEEGGDIPGRLEDMVAVEEWPFRDQVWQGDPPGFRLGGLLAPAGESSGFDCGDLDEAFVKAGRKKEEKIVGS